MAEEKRFTFNIQADVVGDDGKEFFDAHVTYKNMKYEDVVLVEKAIIGMFGGLQQFAEAKVTESKK
jgi:hypothetical protein